MHKPKVWAVQRGAGRDFAVRLGVRRSGLGVGRFEPEAAGDFDGAKDDLEHVQRAAGLETIGVCRNPAHRVKADRAALHGFMRAAAEIGPLNGQLKRFIKRHTGDLSRDGADAVGRNSDGLRHRFGSVFCAEVPLGHVVEHGAVGDAVNLPRAGQIGVYVGGIKTAWLLLVAAPNQLMAVVVPQGQSELG